VAAVLLLGAAAVGSPGREWVPTLRAGRFAVLAGGVFLVGGNALLLYFTLLARYGALETSLVAYAVPVVATLAGVVLLDEQVAPASLISFAVIFLGFVLPKRRAIADLLGV